MEIEDNMQTKNCNKCNVHQDVSNFNIIKTKRKNDIKITFRSFCKKCESEINKNYKLNNKKDISDYNKKYFLNNKNKINNKRRNSYKNKLKIKQVPSEKDNQIKKIYNKNYYKNNENNIRQKRNNRNKIKYKNDLIYKLYICVSNLIRQDLKNNNGYKNNISCKDILLYSKEDLKNRIEVQFEYWMTWNNWGIYNSKTWDDNDKSTWTWQIDHKIPKSKFKCKSIIDKKFNICWSLANLRPYSAKQNILDGNRR